MHRLEAGRTPVGALLVLVEALLLCVLPCTQFLARAFSSFVRHSDAAVLFGVQFESLDGLHYLYDYNVFLFAILGTSLVSMVYFAARPSQRAHLRGALAAMKARREREFRAAERRVERAEAGGAGVFGVGIENSVPSPPHNTRGRRSERGTAPAARSSAPEAAKAVANAAAAATSAAAVRRTAEQRRAASVSIELPPWRHPPPPAVVPIAAKAQP